MSHNDNEALQMFANPCSQTCGAITKMNIVKDRFDTKDWWKTLSGAVMSKIHRFKLQSCHKLHMVNVTKLWNRLAIDCKY